MKFPGHEKFEADQLKTLIYIPDKLPAKIKHWQEWEIVRGRGVFKTRLYIAHNSKLSYRLLKQEGQFTYKIFPFRHSHQERSLDTILLSRDLKFYTKELAQCAERFLKEHPDMSLSILRGLFLDLFFKIS